MNNNLTQTYAASANTENSTTAPDYVVNAFTKTQGNVNLEVDNATVSCFTSKNNTFSLDEEGNLTVKSISSGNDTGFNVLAAYPIGSIYLSINEVNPETLFGGKWEQWGAGRVPVGVDIAQTEFKTVEKTGGEKAHTLTVNEMPSHTHTQNSHKHKISNGGYTYTAGDTSKAWAIACTNSTYQLDTSTVQNTNAATATNQNTGGGNEHNNLQPYITCYMWKRIA